MSIRILTARPHRLFPTVVEEIGLYEKQGQRVLLLVPEQFTLAAERELMQRLQLDGMFLTDVLSPSRLYDHVLTAAGRDGREPLSDAGRRMAVSQALERLEDKLPYYGSITSRRGFAEKLSALLTDLKRGGMTPELLADYASGLEDGLQKEKLRDLASIFAQYQQVLGDRFSDSEDHLTYVASKLAQSHFLDEKHLYVYGFDTLPQQLMKMLCTAAPLCKSLTIALICDVESAKDGELFLPIRQGIGRFSDMLAQEGLGLKLSPLSPRPLDHTPALDHLDRALFVYPPVSLDGQPDGVYLSNALSPYEEATQMTRQVMWLLEQGVDIEKIAVLYPDSDGYEFAVSAALSDSGIPHYTDRQMPALSHGLVRFVLSALRAISGGWRTKDMLAVLKSGYAPFTFDEACELENYVRSCGIDRTRWLTPFTRGEEADRERCEPLRQRLTEPLVKARKAIVDAKDAATSLTAVFQLLIDVNAYETLKREEEDLLQGSLTVRASQNSQIWQTVLDLLDQLARLGGSARIPLKHIATRLECGFSAITLASLPPAGGMLHAGMLGHLLAEEAEAVFLLGLNDSVLTRDTDSLLTPEERERTQTDTGCFLGLTDENRILLAKLDLKRAMTLPRRWLFLSYARTAPDGTALRPLSLLEDLSRHLLPGLQSSPAGSDALPLSAAQALSELSPLIRAHADGVAGLPDVWKKRLQMLLLSSATAPEAMRLLRAVQHDNTAQPLTPRQAQSLFGGEVLSVSRLEQFADCSFQHFIHYGLRPKELREWKVDAIETGTFYHDGLNNFAHLAKRESQYPHIPVERVCEMADEAIAPLLDEVLKGPMGDGERSMARFESARAAIRRAAQTITNHLAAGRFAIYRTEASFGYEKGFPPIVLVLPDGREVALRGRIDRIDRYDSPDSVYLRVIDYKSSQKNLDAAKTWWGLQLQLLLYLDVCTSAIPGAKPAGAFYFYVANPLVESATDAENAVADKLREVFQLRGIALSDVEIIDAMDDDAHQVLPSIHLKSGALRANAKALDESQLHALMQHARKTAAQLAGRLFGGETAICPTCDQNRSACDYCAYRTICHYDEDAPDAAMHEIPSMSMDDLRSALNTQEEQK
ncbi:MAG: PD-(D/E)XK nuclease family protein [Clostridia bacterium]|nr:PD-(D/E)XK nuclease family protein [Clostridia bacterium]